MEIMRVSPLWMNRRRATVRTNNMEGESLKSIDHAEFTLRRRLYQDRGGEELQGGILRADMIGI